MVPQEAMVRPDASELSEMPARTDVTDTLVLQEEEEPQETVELPDN